jgi:hypothetical protein
MGVVEGVILNLAACAQCLILLLIDESIEVESDVILDFEDMFKYQCKDNNYNVCFMWQSCNYW